MANPIWPNVRHEQYLNDRPMARTEQSADGRATQRAEFNHANRLVTLVVLSQTYAVSEASTADFVALLLQGLP